MPTPPPFIEFLISSFIRSSVFLWFSPPPYLPHAYSEPVCSLYLTGHSLHMLMTYLLISLCTIISLALLQHCIMTITQSVTVLPLWLSFFLRSTLFPLWLSQHFRVFSAHMHTQAPIFLSQWSHIVSHFPLQWILAYSVAACYLQLAIHCTWF